MLKWADGRVAGSTAKLECGGSPLGIRAGGHYTTCTIGLTPERLTRHQGLMLIDLVIILILTFTIGRGFSHAQMRKHTGFMEAGSLSLGSAGQMVIHTVRTAGEHPQTITVRSMGVEGNCAPGRNAMSGTPPDTVPVQQPEQQAALMCREWGYDDTLDPRIAPDGHTSDCTLRMRVGMMCASR